MQQEGEDGQSLPQQQERHNRTGPRALHAGQPAWTPTGPRSIGPWPPAPPQQLPGADDVQQAVAKAMTLHRHFKLSETHCCEA